MANAWTKLVTETFKKNRKTNKNYKFKDALVDAKKFYNKSTRTANTMGPAIVKKVARSLKKTMRRGRKQRGGAETGAPPAQPETEVNHTKVNLDDYEKCEDGSSPTVDATGNVKCGDKDANKKPETAQPAETKTDGTTVPQSGTAQPVNPEPETTHGGKRSRKSYKRRH